MDTDDGVARGNYAQEIVGMRHAQKPNHVTLHSLIGWLKSGQFVIPDFQREFEWKPWDVQDLMRSIFQDYYIGSLLLWKGKDENFESLSCEDIYGYEGTRNDRQHIVLDGQQRLTAMYYTFVAPDVSMPQRTNRYIYYIRVDSFMADEHENEEAFQYYWTRWGVNLLKNQQSQFENHMFPLSVIGKGLFELPNWLQGYEKFWQEKQAESDDENSRTIATRHMENAQAFGRHIMEVVEQYQVSYIELDRDIELNKVCEIFTKVNSKGIQLDIFDLINAMVKPKSVELKRMWREAKTSLEFVDTDRMNIYVLQVMSILCQAYCSPKYLYYLIPGQRKKTRNPDGTFGQETLVSDADDFKDKWNIAVKALEHAITSLRNPQAFGVISSRYLPYAAILPAFAALQNSASRLPPDRRLGAQEKIDFWYWASVFLSRYSGSVESTSARDYQDVSVWFNDDSSEPAPISEFRNFDVSSLDLRGETRRGSSVYNGVFNLLIKEGAFDWVRGLPLQPDDLDDHHIVPVARAQDEYLQLDGLEHSILNRTPLTSETNRNIIRDQLPNEYLPQWIEKNGEERVQKILESHFISPTAFKILLRDQFTKDDFNEFINERQRAIQDAICDLKKK